MTKNEMANEIDKALAVLDRDGWIQEQAHEHQLPRNGRHCILGAFETVWRENNTQLNGPEDWDMGFGDPWAEETGRLALYGQQMSLALRPTNFPELAPQLVVAFNDEPGRTYEEVREAMKRRAEELRVQ